VKRDVRTRGEISRSEEKAGKRNEKGSKKLKKEKK
jgi:hypothetical protein